MKIEEHLQEITNTVDHLMKVSSDKMSEHEKKCLHLKIVDMKAVKAWLSAQKIRGEIHETIQ